MSKVESFNSVKIFPNIGIGPFLVGMTERELFEVIPVNTPKRKFSDRYTVQAGAITLWINRKRKQITQIGVSEGFTGSVFGTVLIGSSVQDAEKFLGDFVVNNDYQLIVPGLPGICFSLSPVVNDLSPVPMDGAIITGIYVYQSDNV